MSGPRRPGARRRTPLTIVVFGSSGDLATTKVLPAVEGEMKAGRLPGPVRTVGVDRRPPANGAPSWLRFVEGDLTRQETYATLAEAMKGGSAPAGRTLFYLATAPRLFPEIVRGLRSAGLATPGSRVAVEKPFGVDLKSSRILEGRLLSSFAPKRIFRVDHFLWKAGTVSLEHFRFADGRLEGVWNNRFVDCVQITADEDSAVAGRGDFYDSVGVVRDMVQNHLLQLLCLAAMDRPGSRSARSREAAEEMLLGSVAPISPQDVVLGQYRGYGRVAGVRRGSTTPTFVALKVSIKNRRWGGVPFYLRSGKLLARDTVEVVVAFRNGGGAPSGGSRLPRTVRFRVDPEPSVTLDLGRSEVEWADRNPGGDRGGEYQRILRGVLRGDQRRFVDYRFNELSWRLFDPVVRGGGRPHIYEAGGWGPAASDLLLSREGRSWLDGRVRRAGQGR